MIVAMVATAVVVVAASLLVAYRRLFRRPSPPAELQGDWWSQFESEFRTYARTVGVQRRHHHPQPRRPPRQPSAGDPPDPGA